MQYRAGTIAELPAAPRAVGTLGVTVPVGVAIAAAFALLALFAAGAARAQPSVPGATPSQDVEQVISEAQRPPQEPILKVDRPLYRALQDYKAALNEEY